MIGRFRTRVRIERPVETPDGGGGVARTWALRGIYWAAFEPRNALTRTYDDANVRTARASLTLRGGRDVRPGDHALVESRRFIVRAARAVDDRTPDAVLEIEETSP